MRSIISDLETRTVIMIILVLIASALAIGIAIGLSYAEAINPQPYAISTISWIAAGIVLGTWERRVRILWETTIGVWY